MNKDKIIKDLKERNDKLQSQYMQEQARNYHLNYQIENDLLPTLKGYEQELTSLKAIEKEHQRINGELREEIKQLKKKYENAVADYEYEKSKNHSAIEYMEPRFMNCIDNNKRYFANYDIQQIYEMLKGSDKE